MYLAYKIAYNAGIIMLGKCTSAWVLEFVSKISYLYLFVHIREDSNGQSMAKGPHDLSRYMFICLQCTTNYTCILYVMYKMRQKSCRYRKVYDFSYKIESYTKLKALKTFVFVKDSLSENLILKICIYYSWTLKFDLNHKLFCICIYNFFKLYFFTYIKLLQDYCSLIDYSSHVI